MDAHSVFRTYLSKYIDISDFEYNNLIKPSVIIREFDRKEIITQAGKVENYFNMVIKGIVRKYYKKNNEEFNVQISHEGHFIHSHVSFHTRTPSEYYLDAIEPTTLVSFTYDDFENGLSSSQKMEHMGRVITTQMFILKDKWQMQLVKLNSKERFLQFVEKNPELVQRVPQKDLASYLKIKPETFSRFKHLLKESPKKNQD